MKGFFNTFNYEVRHIARNRIQIASLFIFPTIALLFFACYFNSRAIENLPIVVVDNSKSPLSSKLVEMINATASVKVCYSADSSDEAEAFIRAGKAYAALIIPASFEQDILRNEQVVVVLGNSGTNISTNGFIEKDIESVIATFSAAIELQSGRDMEQVMPIRFTKHILFNPYLDYSYYLAPCFMPMMIIIFTVLSTIITISERKKGGVREFIAKILPTTITMWLFAMVMLLLLFRVVGVPLRGSAAVIIVATLLLVVVYQAIAIFFMGVTRSGHLALSLGGGYSVLAFTLSGLTFPTMAMFPIFRAASYLFPFTYYMEIMIDQSLRGAGVDISMPKIGYMLLFLTLPLFIYKRL